MCFDVKLHSPYIHYAPQCSFNKTSNSESPAWTMIAELWAKNSLEKRHFSEVIELTNQVRSRTPCSPQRAATTTASLLLLWLSLPARSDNSQCEMHRARKSAYASSSGQVTARQFKPRPIPFHFHCLSNWVWPAASQTEHPLTFTVLLPLVGLSTEPQKQERVSVLCVLTIHCTVFVSCFPCQTHAQKNVFHWCQHVWISTSVSGAAPPGALFHKATHTEEDR